MSFFILKAIHLILHVINIDVKICNFSKFFPKMFSSLEITCKQVFLHVFINMYMYLLIVYNM